MVVCDIDGTIADWKPRAKIAGSMPSPTKERKAFQMWLDILQPDSAVVNDPPITPVITTVKALHKAGHTIVYVTGREEHLRESTLVWLKKNKLPKGKLYMRPKKDRWKKPSTYKIEVMLRFVRPGDPIVIIDDDASADCSKQYVKRGWVHLKVIS